MSYVDIAEPLLIFVRASRGKIGCCIFFLIDCSFFGNDKVARRLPTHLWAQEWGFSVQIDDHNPFDQIPVDQTIEETVHKDTQTAGGTRGFGFKPSQFANNTSLPCTVAHIWRLYMISLSYRVLQPCGYTTVTYQKGRGGHGFNSWHSSKPVVKPIQQQPLWYCKPFQDYQQRVVGGWELSDHGKLAINRKILIQLLQCKCRQIYKAPDCEYLVNGLDCTDACP